VAPVNTLTGTAEAPLEANAVGFGTMAMSPDGSMLYIPEAEGPHVGIDEYQPTTGKLTQGAIPVPNDGGIDGIAVSPDGSTLYAVDNGRDIVHVINIATKSVTSTIPVPSTPNFALLSPDGSRLYVLEDAASTVSVINTVTGTVAANIAMPTMGPPSWDYMNPTDTACISPDGSTLYVPGSTGEQIQVVSTATNTITGTLNNSNVRVHLALQHDHELRLELRRRGHRHTTTPATSHVYTGPGPYTATVTETDAAGTSTTTTTLGNGLENLRTGGPQAEASQTFAPLPPGPATLSGVVSHPGNPDCTGTTGAGTTPLAGATVTLLGPDGSTLGTATTDSGGNYSVTGKYEPGQTVQVSGADLSPAVPGQFDLASGLNLSSSHTMQNLTLPNPDLVNVTVTDTTGHPVPGATVGEAASDPTAPFALFPGATAQPGTQSATPQTTNGSGQATLCPVLRDRRAPDRDRTGRPRLRHGQHQQRHGHHRGADRAIGVTGLLGAHVTVQAAGHVHRDRRPERQRRSHADRDGDVLGGRHATLTRHAVSGWPGQPDPR